MKPPGGLRMENFIFSRLKNNITSLSQRSDLGGVGDFQSNKILRRASNERKAMPFWVFLLHLIFLGGTPNIATSGHG